MKRPRNLHYMKLSFVIEAEDALTEEILYYQRTGEARNRLGALIELIFRPILKKAIFLFYLDRSLEQDVWQDVYIKLQLILLKYDIKKGPAGLWVLWQGYYVILKVCKEYYNEKRLEILLDVKEDVRSNCFYADDFVAVLNTFDWAYPAEVCLFASMIVICGNGGRDGASVKKMLRNTYAGGDKVLTQHIYNHVVVNTRIALSVVSDLHNLEGYDETLGVGAEGIEEDFNSLRVLSDFWGSYNEEIDRPVRGDNLSDTNVGRDRESWN